MRRLIFFQAGEVVGIQHPFEAAFKSHVFPAQAFEFPLLAEDHLVEIVNVMLQQRKGFLHRDKLPLKFSESCVTVRHRLSLHQEGCETA